MSSVWYRGLVQIFSTDIQYRYSVQKHGISTCPSGLPADAQQLDDLQAPLSIISYVKLLQINITDICYRYLLQKCTTIK